MYFILLVFGFLLYKDYSRLLFVLGFNTSLLFSVIFIESYVAETNLPFIPGGDAERYHEIVTDAIRGDRDKFYGRYLLYLKTVYYYYKFILSIGGSLNYYFFVLLNIFISTHIAPLLYKIGSKFFTKGKCHFKCLLFNYFFH